MFYINAVVKDLAENDRCIISNKNLGKLWQFRNNSEEIIFEETIEILNLTEKEQSLFQIIQIMKFSRKFWKRINASKLIEKYNNLAESLSVNDKILSENYFQHSHFTRILNDQKIIKS